MKKPRSDAKLKTLHPAKQEALWEMCQGVSYTDVVARLKAEWDGFETSEASLSAWYAWYPFSRELSEFQELKAELRQELESNPDLNLDSDEMLRMTEAIFAHRAARTKDSALFVEIRKLRQKDRDQDAAERRLLLLEQREEKAKKLLNNEKLSPEQRDEKMRATFGLPPKPAEQSAPQPATE